MAKHINHFDAQSRIANSFKKTAKRNESDNEDLSLEAQLKRELERKQQNINKPKEAVKQAKRYAGWVVVKRYDIIKQNKIK